ncbi:MAG: amidohydrolase family protein [Planctomycetales bacterium]|nr:amidohydrolase family protein [Planctomycetales bacterium]
MSPPCLAFTGGTLILPDRLVEEAVVVCREGQIVSLGRRPPPKSAHRVELHGAYLAPGFIDIHVHGGNGADFMDGSLPAVRTACAAHLRHGTTTIFPTTTTGSASQILAMLDACEQYQRQHAERPWLGPHLPGVHLYGPYFAEDKVGCHAVAGCRPPRQEEFKQYFATGLVRIATCAAELAGAVEFYRAARRQKCLITCGHSNANWAEMQVAFQAGMRHVDHFWCAMSSVPSLRQRFNVPMQASMNEFVLMHEAMSTEVIADGCHLAPELLEFAYRMKGPQRLCLVTDSNRALDMPPGRYRFGNAVDGSWLESDGKVGWSADGESLASSIMGMDHMVRHMRKSCSATLPEVVRMASLTPAERTGIDQLTGSIARGKRADLLVLSRQLKVKRVFIGGQEVCGEEVSGEEV